MRIEGIKHPTWLPSEIDDAQRALVRQSLDDIEERLRPATEEEILTFLTALAEYYGIAGREGLSTTFVMMVQDLKGYSFAHIEAAIVHHRQTNNWFPKSAELRPLCEDRRSMAKHMRRRARILLGFDEAQSWEITAVARFKAQEERKRAEAAVPELEDRIAKLPPALAAATRRMVEAAKQTEENRTSKGTECSE